MGGEEGQEKGRGRGFSVQDLGFGVGVLEFKVYGLRLPLALSLSTFLSPWECTRRAELEKFGIPRQFLPHSTWFRLRSLNY